MDSYNNEFWNMIDVLLSECEIVIDRLKGSCHPKYSSTVYPVDYGYLKDTSSMDGGGIDVWKGTAAEKSADAVILTVDILKKDSEIKILLGCTEEEKDMIYAFHNDSKYMKGIMINRK